MKIKNWLFLALTLCLTASAAIAQTSKGTVGGVVTDQSGAVVVGATVILTSTQTNVSRTTTTNNEGYYRFDAVDLGTYDIKYSAESFGELTKSGVVVLANQISDIGAQLQAGGNKYRLT